MLSLGGEIGILRNVEVNSLSADIAYTVTHPRGLAGLARFMSDPVGFARVPVDEDQKSLTEFLMSLSPSATTMSRATRTSFTRGLEPWITSRRLGCPAPAGDWQTR